MNVLYYREPKSVGGGVSDVAYYLSRALEEKTNMTRYPKSMSGGFVDFLHIGRRFVKNEFDIIHFNYVPILINGSRFLLELAKKRGIITVLNVHGIIPLEQKFDPIWKGADRNMSWIQSEGAIIRTRLGLFEAMRACKIADRIVINAEHMRTKIIASYGVDNAKIVVIPNGVSLTQFNPSGDKLELEGDPALLHVGWLSGLKGSDVLFEAIAKLQSELPKMKLHLLGYSPDEYDRVMRRKGIEEFLVFHGWTPHSKISSYYRSADMCIFPSRHEGFSVAFLEAMASGIPIIASDIGIFREILSDGKYGVLFESENADSLSKAILGLWQDMNHGKKLSEAALKAVGRYDWANIAEQYSLLYKSLMESNK